MFITTRFFYPHGIEGEAMDNTSKEFNDLDKAINHANRYAAGLRFAGVQVEDEKRNIIYEITSDMEAIDHREQKVLIEEETHMDKNNIKIKTGDIVKIEGGFFKADNGLFQVIHSPGDSDWLGSDWCLYRINKNGTISASKHKTAFWPLMVTVSSQDKRIEAREHNKNNATIEVVKAQGTPADPEVVAVESVEVAPAIEYKFKIGDKVNWTNSNGVNLGVRTVIGLDSRTNRATYYIDPIDTPWFDVGEEELEECTLVAIKIVEPLETIQPIEVVTEEPTPSMAIIEAISVTETLAPTTTTQSTNLINEALAQRSKENMSFSNYKTGSATAEFNQEIAEVRAAIEKAKLTVSPEAQAKLDRLLASHISRYAAWTNKRNANGAGHVSQMICGAGNYNMRNHEKYLNREGKLWAEYEEFKNIHNRIESIMVGDRIIKSNDANAIDKLKEKLAAAQEEHAAYKEYNAQARKNSTAPHRPYVLQNSNGRIKGIKDRIAHLERLAAQETKEIIVEAATEETNGIRIVDNVEAHRLQIFFNGKPSAEVRTQLKKNGFRWTPSISAWQSYRSDHASRAAQEIVSAI